MAIYISTVVLSARNWRLFKAVGYLPDGRRYLLVKTMPVTAVDSSSSLRALEGELQSSLQSSPPSAPSPSDSLPRNSQVSSPPRRHSKALSISSLSDENASGTNFVATKVVATEACRDVERELAAIETRLSVFRGRRRQNDSGSTHPPLQSKTQDGSNCPTSPDKEVEDAAVSPSSSVSSNAVDASSPIFSKLFKAQQEAGAVADQVATTLMKCDQLLQRVKSCGKLRQL